MMIGLELPNMSNQQGPGRLLLIFLTKSFLKDSNHVVNSNYRLPNYE